MEIQELKEIYKKHGGKWNEVNIFGLRNETEPGKDLFNDIIGIATEEEIHEYPGTTDPSVYWTATNPITYGGVTGAAHLVEGFYNGIWRVGIHAQGTPFAHEALIQTGNKVKIWRDTNKDFKNDDEPIQEGYFGINCHRAGLDDPKNIGRYGAGCQVIRDHENFIRFMAIIKNSEKFKRQKMAARFNYLLLNFNNI